MAVEYELKFQCSRETLQAIPADFSGSQRQYAMQTTYYDTPSGAVSARRYTLRHRMENETHVCTLKTPAVGSGRNEMEVFCEHIQQAIPYFCEQGAPADFADLVKEGLIPICGARFRRVAIDVTYGDCMLELALDQGVLLGGGKELPFCEVEVELKSGSPEGADLFALELANRYGLTPEPKSKFKRALQLYKGEVK